MFRFASPVVTTGSGTITASVTDAESTIISRKIEIQKSLKTESFPAIVPLTPLPVFPLTIKGLQSVSWFEQIVWFL